ncbi:MAG: hypothetical protein ACFFG0_06060 [Candidatus Thorarchaeota archaeon]
MPVLGKIKTKGAGVTLVDVLIVLFMSIFTYFVAQAWDNPLAPHFVSIGFALIPIYLIAMFTGYFKILKLTRPTWTVSAIISIPIWPVISRLSSSLSEQQFAENNPLVRLFGVSFFNNAIQSFIVPFYETIILVGLIIGIILIFRNQNFDKSKSIIGGLRREKRSIIPILLIFLGAVGGLFHYVIAFTLSDQQQIAFNTFMAHQFISFYIFALFSLIFGLSGGIASHIIKNLLAFGTAPIILGFFILFIILDIISLFTTPKAQSSRSIKATIGV